jgi:micrococcal nuclease
MIQKYLNVIAFLCTACIFLLYGSKGISSQNAGRSADSVRTDKIYDGDTVGAVVNGRFEKIRLLGIDAPEMEQKPWGRKSRDCTGALLKASTSRVSLEYDLEQRDKYGRILAYIWTQDGKMLNEEILRKGCAVLFTFPPNVKYAGRFRAAQKKARDLKAGLWGENGLHERPYEFRKEHPRR